MCPPIPLPLRNARFRTATHIGYSPQARHKVNCPKDKRRSPLGGYPCRATRLSGAHCASRRILRSFSILQSQFSIGYSSLSTLHSSLSTKLLPPHSYLLPCICSSLSTLHSSLYCTQKEPETLVSGSFILLQLKRSGIELIIFAVFRDQLLMVESWTDGAR